MTNENKMRRQRLSKTTTASIFHGEDKEPHPLHAKGDWVPPVQRSVALENYLETVKTEISKMQLTKPKYNLPKLERNTVKEIKNNTAAINIKKSDKGTTTALLNNK